MTLEQRTGEEHPSAKEGAPVEVFLVEDNPGDAVLIRQCLAQWPFPARLHLAIDGEQALHMLVDEGIQPSLIILDLNIPRIPGLSLLASWQRSPVPVVVFSSSWNEAEIERALALGAREFVHKPTELDSFTQAVWHILDRWANPEHPLSS